MRRNDTKHHASHIHLYEAEKKLTIQNKPQSRLKLCLYTFNIEDWATKEQPLSTVFLKSNVSLNSLCDNTAQKHTNSLIGEQAHL